MIDRAKIAEVVRYNDAESEEHEDMNAFFTSRGVEPDGVMHVAMQRGLRIVMIEKGINPNQSKPLTVSLTSDEQARQVRYAGIWIDAFAAGLGVSTT